MALILKVPQNLTFLIFDANCSGSVPHDSSTKKLHRAPGNASCFLLKLSQSVTWRTELLTESLELRRSPTAENNN